MRAARKPTPANDTPPPAGHNTITSDQRQALALMHRRIYRAKMAIKREADAAVRNACKVIKADLGENGLLQVKDMMARETPEGAAKADAELQARAEVRVWVSDDRQMDMFPVATKRADSEAFLQGKIAGMDDLPCASPYSESTVDGEDWIRGWGVGKSIMDELLAERAAPVAELIEGAGHDGDLDDGEQD
jgi:uncharacterized membrane protein